jgi:hypothetical protein
MTGMTGMTGTTGTTGEDKYAGRARKRTGGRQQQKLL